MKKYLLVGSFLKTLVDSFKNAFNETAQLIISAVLSIGTTFVLVLFIVEIVKFFAMRKNGEDTNEIVGKLMLYGGGLALLGTMTTISWVTYFGK